jgi:hypothetical protein
MSGRTGTGGTTPNKLEELHTRSVCEFPKPLFIEGIREMFRHIRDQSPYVAELYVDQTEPYGTRELDVPDVTKLTGRIEEVGNAINSATFTIDRRIDDIYDVSIFQRLSFQTIPGCLLEEHKKEEVTTWDGTREAVKAYFASLGL